MKINRKIRLSLKAKKVSRVLKHNHRSPRSSKITTKIAKKSRKKTFRIRRKWIKIAKMMRKNRKNHRIITTISRRSQETITTTMTGHRKLSLLGKLMFSKKKRKNKKMSQISSSNHLLPKVTKKQTIKSITACASYSKLENVSMVISASSVMERSVYL